MQITVLGPLEVWQDGAPRTPSAPKLRQLLALLAVYANNVVRNDQIIEELWEEKPPASVTTTLQTYVYQLRRLLNLEKSSNGTGSRSSPKPALHTAYGGYLLAVSPELLDSFRFEELSERGRAELDAGEVRLASRTLSTAIELWRGPALVDVSAGPILRAEALRLEELRRSTLERRIAADLRLGRHQELLGELTGLAAQQPTHEGFQASLMLALYRSGRRSEALRVYHRARTALAEELGLDPSGELQRLYGAVLASDHSLDLPPATTGRPVRAPSQPPCHLPPKGTELAGRDRELAGLGTGLLATAHRTPPVEVITGPPGSGKSALAVHVAYRVRGAFPDGQLYCRMLDDEGRPADPGEVLGAFLRGLGVPGGQLPATTNERCLLFRTLTADRRVLVVADDIADESQLRTLLPTGDGCGVLVTSRRRLSGPVVTGAVELAPLGLEDGLAMLTTAVGAERVRHDPDAARDLVKLCDGLPRALDAVAAKLQVRPHWTIRRMIHWIEDELARPSTDPFGLRASVERSVRALPGQARTVFRTLAGAGAAALSTRAAAAALDVDEHTAESLLEDLVEAGLIQATPDDGVPGGFRYRCLRALREAGRRLADRPGTLPPAHPTEEQARRNGAPLTAWKRTR